MAKQVRRFMTFLFAAAHVVANVFYSAAYAAGALPARATSSQRAPATPAPTGRKAYYEAEKRASGDIAGVLSRLKMTPAQRLSVRNYIGQAHAGVKIEASGSAGGVTSFAIKNAKNGALVGRIGVSAATDGSIVVNKSTAADLDFKKSVSMPVTGKVDEKDAHSVLSGSQQLVLMEADLKKPTNSASLPGLHPIEGLDFAYARQCTARFNPDGSGYEYCLVSKPTAAAKTTPPVPTVAKAGNQPVTGKQSGSGSVAVKAVATATTAVALEGFVNYFSRPSVDKGGHVNRSVLSGHYPIDSTMTQVQQQGSVSTGSVEFSPNLAVPVRPEVGIPEGGETEPEQVPEEQTAAPQPEESGQPEEQQDEEQPADEWQPGEDERDQEDQGQGQEDQQGQDQQGDEDENEDDSDAECGGAGIPGLPGLYLGGPRCEEPNALQHEMEEEDYEKAVRDGSPEALQTYLKEHPDSDQAADVLNLLELGAAGESYSDFDNSGSPENTTPSEDTPYN